MLDATMDEYLSRIGATKPTHADIQALRHLQERHVLSVPFENLDYHLDEPINLGENVLEKIVKRRRGGGCYEVNPAFAFLLQKLGFKVDILPGQVYRPEGLGPPMGHLVLKVESEEAWLVDVGFGRNSRLPLLMDSTSVQEDPHGKYQLVKADRGGIDVLRNGKPLYQIDDRPCQLEDFRPTLWWWKTSPDSPFLQDMFCSMPTADGRATLRGNRVIRVANGERVIEELVDEAAILMAYKKHFGITLDRLPKKPVTDASRTVGIRTD